MLAKMSLKSFVYDIIDVFCFPDKKVKGIFDKHDMEKCFLYLNLTDTDSCSMFFIFICKLECCIPENVFTNVLFDIFKHSKLVQGWTFLKIFGNSLTCGMKKREQLWDFMKLKTLIMQISVQLQ